MKTNTSLWAELAVIVMLFTACGQDKGGNNDRSDNCHCDRTPVSIDSGTYIKQDFSKLGYVGEACFKDGICTESVVTSPDEVKVTFTKETRTYEATFKVTLKETR